MCYPKPGPRCSEHAKQRLDKINNQIRELHKQLKEGYEIAARNPNSEEAVEASNFVEEKRRQLYAKTEQKKYAELQYESTPAGINELREKAENCDNHHLKQGFLTQVERAEAARAQMLRLHRLRTVGAEEGDGYRITPQMGVKAAVDAATAVGDGNVYVSSGRTVSAPTRERQQQIQNRLDLLVSYFAKEDGSVKISLDHATAYHDLNLTPGFKYLDCGAHRLAYVDEETGMVMKLPIMANKQLFELDDMIEREQRSYAVLELDDTVVDGHRVEHVETLFYRSTTHRDVPVVVQPYLDPETHALANEKYPSKFTGTMELLEEIPGLSDVHTGNLRLRADGTIVLFDCLGMEHLNDDYEDEDDWDGGDW